MSCVETSARALFNDLMVQFPDMDRVVLSDTDTGHLIIVISREDMEPPPAAPPGTAANEAYEDDGSDSIGFAEAHIATTTYQQLAKLGLGVCRTITAVYDDHCVVQLIEPTVTVSCHVDRHDGASCLGVLSSRLPSVCASDVFKDICAGVKKALESY
eukprot:PhM_4_TR15604/c0_g1_i1/m.34346